MRSSPNAALPRRVNEVAAVKIASQGNTLTFASIEAEAGLKAALAMSRPDIIDTVSA